MAYATAATILTLIPGLPQTTTSAGYTTTSARITSHITRADNMINGKISNRYEVSAFSSVVPPLLISLSEDITTYFVLRSIYSSDNQNVTQWLEKFELATDMLDLIRDGKMDLVNTAGSLIGIRSTTAMSLVDSNTQDYAPTFGEDKVLDWIADTEKLNDISDDRS